MAGALEGTTPDPIEGAPPAMTWDDYVPVVNDAWTELLAHDDATEPDVLAFLAKHPALVPGTRGFEGGHHGAIHSCLFREARLPGIRCPVPDFMWVVRDTEAVRPILIEIESPQKKWFKKRELPTDEFTQALGQLSEWRAFFESPANILQFRTLYELNDPFWRDRPLRPSYCLVFGRQSEFADHMRLLAARRGMRPANTEWMTFDSLAPDGYAQDVFCVQVHVNGDWDAVQAAPTLRLGPGEAEDFVRFSKREEAIDRNEFMTPDRKAFLKDRLGVWDQWARSDRKGARRPSHG